MRPSDLGPVLMLRMVQRIAKLERELERVRAAASGLEPTSGLADNHRLSVQTLGDFVITVGSETLALPSRRDRRLFQRITHDHPRPVSRDVLIAEFWPVADVSTGRNRLNAAVHSLRRRFRDAGITHDVIVYEAGAYRFSTKILVDVDADSFASGVGLALNGGEDLDSDLLDQLSGAVGLYRGDYLEAEAYEEWTMTTRRRLRQLYIGALGVIARHRLDRNELEACIDACQRITAIEPAHEVAHRWLIIALGRSGRTSEALKQFEVCRYVLAEELDVEPSAITRAAVQALQR